MTSASGRITTEGAEPMISVLPDRLDVEPRPRGSETTRPMALAIADASWFTTDHLFREIRRGSISTLLLHCMDYRNAWVRGIPPWQWGRGPLRQAAPRVWERRHALPPGWM